MRWRAGTGPAIYQSGPSIGSRPENRPSVQSIVCARALVAGSPASRDVTATIGRLLRAKPRLAGLVLSQSICAAMRAERPSCEASLHRVFALLLANLALLSAASALGQLRRLLPGFVAAP
jgi:hypothetical protein